MPLLVSVYYKEVCLQTDFSTGEYTQNKEACYFKKRTRVVGHTHTSQHTHIINIWIVSGGWCGFNSQLRNLRKILKSGWLGLWELGRYEMAEGTRSYRRYQNLLTTYFPLGRKQWTKKQGRPSYCRKNSRILLRDSVPLGSLRNMIKNSCTTIKNLHTLFTNVKLWPAFHMGQMQQAKNFNAILNDSFHEYSTKYDFKIKAQR